MKIDFFFFVGTVHKGVLQQKKKKKTRRNTGTVPDVDATRNETFVFTPVVIGKHNVKVEYNGKALAGCPYAVNVTPPICTLLGVASKGVSCGIEFDAQLKIIGDPTGVTGKNPSSLPAFSKRCTIYGDSTFRASKCGIPALPLLLHTACLPSRASKRDIFRGPTCVLTVVFSVIRSIFRRNRNHSSKINRNKRYLFWKFSSCFRRCFLN
jgi:hypothetical protein